MSRVFAVPALVAAASLAGLFSALLGDGPADWLAWAALAAPVAVTAHARFGRVRGRRVAAQPRFKGKQHT